LWSRSCTSGVQRTPAPRWEGCSRPRACAASACACCSIPSPALRPHQVLSEVYNWITVALADFGLPCFDIKLLLKWAKEDLQSANAGVRNSVILMLGAMHRYAALHSPGSQKGCSCWGQFPRPHAKPASCRFLGPPLAELMRADVKPALMAAMEAEFVRCPKHVGWTPTRSSRAEGDKAVAAPNGAHPLSLRLVLLRLAPSARSRHVLCSPPCRRGRQQQPGESDRSGRYAAPRRCERLCVQSAPAPLTHTTQLCLTCRPSLVLSHSLAAPLLARS
jgi:hypothetical protein